MVPQIMKYNPTVKRTAQSLRAPLTSTLCIKEGSIVNTKQLRVKYHNGWPRKFDFPAKQEFAEKMQVAGFVSPPQ